MHTNTKKYRIFTWHVHGSYLLYLTQADCDFYLPYLPGVPGYGGKTKGFPFGDNVYQIPAEEVKNHDFDCIVFQSKKNYQEDQYHILSEKQRSLPRIYLEHDPPREHPTETKHIVDDPEILLIHVIHFNNVMWDNGRTPTKVIEHGVYIPYPGAMYTGELEKGIVVLNGLATRGRRMGFDIFQNVREKIPLDLIGMEYEKAGGVGEVPLTELPLVLPRYRFFFYPVRYTSFGLAVCEAMMLGLPIVALATTEMATVIKNGETGFIDTNIDSLIDKMKLLLKDKGLARTLGENARAYAEQRFGIQRFAKEWEETFAFMASGKNTT
ncbi:MAG: glycosyltransferase [wastewater metagenome]|nr:glycosyltransferase [Candidatus Loosdrechtia aerotolerans]